MGGSDVWQVPFAAVWKNYGEFDWVVLRWTTRQDCFLDLIWERLDSSPIDAGQQNLKLYIWIDTFNPHFHCMNKIKSKLITQTQSLRFDLVKCHTIDMCDLPGLAWRQNSFCFSHYLTKCRNPIWSARTLINFRKYKQVDRSTPCWLIAWTLLSFTPQPTNNTPNEQKDNLNEWICATFNILCGGCCGVHEWYICIISTWTLWKWINFESELNFTYLSADVWNSIMKLWFAFHLRITECHGLTSDADSKSLQLTFNLQILKNVF